MLKAVVGDEPGISVTSLRRAHRRLRPRDRRPGHHPGRAGHVGLRVRVRDGADEPAPVPGDRDRLHDAEPPVHVRELLPAQGARTLRPRRGGVRAGAGREAAAGAARPRPDSGPDGADGRHGRLRRPDSLRNERLARDSRRRDHVSAAARRSARDRPLARARGRARGRGGARHPLPRRAHGRPRGAHPGGARRAAGSRQGRPPHAGGRAGGAAAGRRGRGGADRQPQPGRVPRPEGARSLGRRHRRCHGAPHRGLDRARAAGRAGGRAAAAAGGPAGAVPAGAAAAARSRAPASGRGCASSTTRCTALAPACSTPRSSGWGLGWSCFAASRIRASGGCRPIRRRSGCGRWPARCGGGAAAGWGSPRTAMPTASPRWMRTGGCSPRPRPPRCWWTIWRAAAARGEASRSRSRRARWSSGSPAATACRCGVIRSASSTSRRRWSPGRPTWPARRAGASASAGFAHDKDGILAGCLLAEIMAVDRGAAARTAGRAREAARPLGLWAHRAARGSPRARGARAAARGAARARRRRAGATRERGRRAAPRPRRRFPDAARSRARSRCCVSTPRRAGRAAARRLRPGAAGGWPGCGRCSGARWRFAVDPGNLATQQGIFQGYWRWSSVASCSA